MNRTFMFTLLISLFFITNVIAQQLPPNCAPLSVIVDKLQQKYNEVPLFSGRPGKNETVDPNQPLLIIFVNKETGTYSAITVLTDPKGFKIGCMMSSGDHYKENPVIPISKNNNGQAI